MKEDPSIREGIQKKLQNNGPEIDPNDASKSIESAWDRHRFSIKMVNHRDALLSARLTIVRLTRLHSPFLSHGTLRLAPFKLAWGPRLAP